jgi:hypothetical protein
VVVDLWFKKKWRKETLDYREGALAARYVLMLKEMLFLEKAPNLSQ